MSKVNEFTQLRLRAKERRDKALAKIRAEYETALADIARLEQLLCGRDTAGKPKISAAIESVLPIDEPFTIADVMRGLEALDASRVWPIATVRRHLTFLKDRKLIKRLKRHNVHQPAVYLRSDKPAEPTLNDKPLKKVIGELITEPMRTAEVVHAVLEAGWETTMSRDHFRTHVRSALREAGFKEKNGKWGKW